MRSGTPCSCRCRATVETTRSRSGSRRRSSRRSAEVWVTSSTCPIANRNGASVKTCRKGSSLFDHKALRAAAEIALHIGKPRHGEARAIAADPGYGVEQNPFADRLARHVDAEIGVEEGPFLPVQRAGGVAEIGGCHRA